MNIILASKSPRRKQLLEQAGFSITVKTKDVDESYPDNLGLDNVAEYISKIKANAAKCFLEDAYDLIITSDTVVIFENTILGKPKDKQEAVQILKSLSGKMHRVITGVSMRSLTKTVSFSDQSSVWFNPLSDEEIDYYLEKYQPYDKAGSYGIQEWIGLCKISKIEGTYANIMGLPVNKIYEQIVKW